VVFNGILKLMPSLSRTVNCQQLTINSRSRGFTLIELLVVITLFAITSSLITASYLTFEKNQRIKNAAQTLKNDLRFVQNKALAGDKGANSECPITSTLVGWYLTFNTSQTSTYTYTGACNTGGTESYFIPKTITYPSGVTLNNAAPNTGIKLGGTPQSGTVTVLFKPLTTGAVLYSNAGPPFSNLIDFTGDLVIELKGQQTSTLSIITVRSTGEISGGQ